MKRDEGVLGSKGAYGAQVQLHTPAVNMMMLFSVSATHGPGAKKIKLDTDEEIRRWREERRRNYPTLRTVEQKQKLQELKEQRGDVLRTQQFGRFRLPAAPPRVLQRSADGDGDPLAALDSGEHGSDPEEHQQTGDTVAPRSITSALGALMASYSSSGESDGEQHGDSRAPPHREQKRSPSLPDPLLYGAGRLLSQSRPPQCSQKPPARGRSAPFKPAEAFRQRHTLLEMLLAPEIRRERNVVLQCVRFIVQHGFFHSGADAEIGQSERS
ncbi:hypothetical protein DNTS_003501 [Danionella cerebrum]|uniref:FMR1-interacting protein 1 conserved domain-containing protein n=1 Tax=Danionella cerebrum TaxID=2873325 RepID=A0A553MLG3_9TELE|nr:hypothetical protein DNTS_003501 [Danionella translucida]TRY54021.1 hypothetical protein DNTS_003501 [Danionella translucida]